MKVCKQGSHQIIHIKARRCQYRKNMPSQISLENQKPKRKFVETKKISFHALGYAPFQFNFHY